MKHLMVTWTDVFNATGDFFMWIFKGMRVLGQGPNIIIWILIGGGIAYWTFRLMRYKKEAQRNSTVE